MDIQTYKVTQSVRQADEYLEIITDLNSNASHRNACLCKNLPGLTAVQMLQTGNFENPFRGFLPLNRSVFHKRTSPNRKPRSDRSPKRELSSVTKGICRSLPTIFLFSTVSTWWMWHAWINNRSHFWIGFFFKLLCTEKQGTGSGFTFEQLLYSLITENFLSLFCPSSKPKNKQESKSIMEI